MFYYHGNKSYYLAEILLYNQELKTFLYDIGLVGEYERFAYAIADAFYNNNAFNSFLTSDLTANELYDQLAESRTSEIFSTIQSVIASVYKRVFAWYYVGNKPLYVNILKAIIYGSIKHFFFENKDKYLPQYDWYLINTNSKRKTIIDILFKEFDKLTNVFDSVKYYQDIDDIPLEYMVYLQEITGLTMNTYNNMFNEKQLRSLTKHLIEVWREKGELFSLELFFACMGINCTAQELWFDRRLYYNSENFNNYTNTQSRTSFGYYLTPEQPYLTTYDFSSEKIKYQDCTSPVSSRLWDYYMSQYPSEERDDIVRQLLGMGPSDLDVVYTYFKSNYLLLDFSHIGSGAANVSKNELNVYKELLKKIIPVFIRIYYGNELADSYENIDVLKSYDLGSIDSSTIIVDNKNNQLDATLFTIFDTNSKDSVPLTLSVPGSTTFNGRGFVSGSYIKVNNEGLPVYVGTTLTPTEEFSAEFSGETEYGFIEFNQSEDEFDPELEAQETANDWNTFEPEGGEHRNLFEISNYKTANVNAYNDLYNEETWVGDIQYEYYDPTNPLQYIEANLDAELTVTLI